MNSTDRMKRNHKSAQGWIAKLAGLTLALLVWPQALLSAAEPALESARGENAASRVWLTFGLDHVPGLGVEVLGQVPLNQKAGLALARAGTQVMVLGLTAERISLLKEMPLSEFALEETVQAGEVR